MKAYLLKETDFQHLLSIIDRDPAHGENGGQSVILTNQEREAFSKAHRFYNYQIRTWIDSVTK
jgi:hypothetical protein